jgi:acetone carboxylase gamma subunit
MLNVQRVVDILQDQVSFNTKIVFQVVNRFISDQDQIKKPPNFHMIV